MVNEVIEECETGGPISVPALRELDWIIPDQSNNLQHAQILLELDKGEKYILNMACKHQAGLVIIDEKIGRNGGRVPRP